MKICTKTVSRLELFKKVWETPIIQLAKEYGLSDVGLAKICKKHNIPRPPRGYWAKKSAGQRLQQEPLPKKPSNEFIEIRPNPSNQLSAVADSEILQRIDSDKNYPPIVIPKSLRTPHPLIQKSRQILELCPTNDSGILIATDKQSLDIQVSRKSLLRALRILDALIKGLIDRGYEVGQNDGLIRVQIHGELLEFGISEEVITKKTQPRDIDLDGYYQFGHSRFDRARVPSGKLCLTIHHRAYYWGDNLRKNWRDTKKRKLEDCLDSFVIGLIKTAAQKKKYRHQKEEEERQRQEMTRQTAEAERRRAEFELKIQKEKARVAKLITDAENFCKSRQIREFIAAVENERLNAKQIYISDEEYNAWIKWALDQADRLDPLADSPASILDKVIESADGQSNDVQDGSDSIHKKW